MIGLAFAPAGELLAAASADGLLLLIHGATGEERHRVAAHRLGLNAIAWAPGGDRLGTAGQDGFVGLWHPLNGESLGSLEAGAQWVQCVQWSSDGQLLATAAGRVLRLWSAEGVLLREFVSPSGSISALAWEPDRHVVAVAAQDTIILYRPDQPAPVLAYRWPSETVSLAWSPDASFLAAGGKDGVVHLWIMPTVDEIEMVGYTTTVKHLAWDSTSRFLATAGGPSVPVWDCAGAGPAGRRPLFCRWHRPLVTGLALQPQALILASAGADGRVLVWNLDPFERLALGRLGSPATGVAWSADGSFLAAGTESGDLVVFAAPPSAEPASPQSRHRQS